MTPMGFRSSLQAALKKALAGLNVLDVAPVIEQPADDRHGDYSSNVAMLLAPRLKKAPLEIAKEIIHNLPKLEFIERIKVEKPGFINFHLKEKS
ncbi:MAG: arginine--tRNA ligase, partial [Candidatus Moranbacteria bacterium]|nr:arginine--tRNA ligase [Candidatus Moranbacteria bacterium]